MRIQCVPGPPHGRPGNEASSSHDGLGNMVLLLPHSKTISVFSTHTISVEVASPASYI